MIEGCKDCEIATKPQFVDIVVQKKHICTIQVIACPMHAQMMKDIMGDFDKAFDGVLEHWKEIVRTMEAKVLDLSRKHDELIQKLNGFGGFHEAN